MASISRLCRDAAKEPTHLCATTRTHPHNLLTADTSFRFYQFYALHFGRVAFVLQAFPFLNIRHDDHKENGSGRFIVRSSFWRCLFPFLLSAGFYGAWSTSGGLLFFYRGHNGKHGCYGHNFFQLYHVQQAGTERRVLKPREALGHWSFFLFDRYAFERA